MMEMIQMTMMMISQETSGGINFPQLFLDQVKTHGASSVRRHSHIVRLAAAGAAAEVAAEAEATVRIPLPLPTRQLPD